MLIVLNLSDPEDDDGISYKETASRQTVRKELNRERVTRVQVINLHGEIVDVEH